MEGHELLRQTAKVGAPAEFEAAVLARLPAARLERARRARRATVRYAFAGSAALILAAVLVFRPAPGPSDAVLTSAERQALIATPDRATGSLTAGRGRIVPVYETMDYASEFRNVQSRPATVYILEQVSEVPSTEIIY
jgi:hypothetical protein